MKHSLTILLIGGIVLITAHRSPAPVTEIPETPTATPAPKPSQVESIEEKAAPKKAKPKARSAETESPAKRPAVEAPTRVSVSGTWRGRWTNSRGEQGMAKVTFNEGPNGLITGEGDALPLSGRPPLQNGHRSGNSITYSFHRGGRDYQVIMTASSDGSTLSGEYKVVQGQNIVYTGHYIDFKRE